MFELRLKTQLAYAIEDGMAFEELDPSNSEERI